MVKQKHQRHQRRRKKDKELADADRAQKPDRVRLENLPLNPPQNLKNMNPENPMLTEI